MVEQLYEPYAHLKEPDGGVVDQRRRCESESPR
jgi:hypothetical protein